MNVHCVMLFLLSLTQLYVGSNASDECGATSSATTGEITTVNYDQPYRGTIPCTWIIECSALERIQLTISSFDYTEHEQFLTIWTLDENDLQFYEKFHKVDSKTFEFAPATNVIVHLASSYMVKLEPIRLNYTKVASVQQNDKVVINAKSGDQMKKTQCTGYFSSPEGVIYPKEFQDEHVGRSTCLWIIKAVNNEQIKLNVLALQPQISELGHISIWKWSERQLQYETSVSSARQKHEFGKNQSVLIFLTMDSEEFSWGFHMQYKKIVKNENVYEVFDASTPYMDLCGEKLTAPLQTVQTIVEESLPICTTYMWMVVLNPNEEISFQLAYSQPDPPGWVDVMIWAIDEENLELAKQIHFMEDQTKQFVIDRTVLIMFTTENFSFHSKLSMKYEKYPEIIYGHNSIFGVENLWNKQLEQCGGNLLATQGTITGPSYSDGYPSHTLCLWLIVARDHETISLSFKDLQLDSQTYDHVTLWTMDEQALVPYGNYYERPYTTMHRFKPGQNLLVSLQSDESSSFCKLVLEYKKYSVRSITVTQAKITTEKSQRMHIVRKDQLNRTDHSMESINQEAAINYSNGTVTLATQVDIPKSDEQYEIIQLKKEHDHTDRTQSSVAELGQNARTNNSGRVHRFVVLFVVLSFVAYVLF